MKAWNALSQAERDEILQKYLKTGGKVPTLRELWANAYVAENECGEIEIKILPPRSVFDSLKPGDAFIVLKDDGIIKEEVFVKTKIARERGKRYNAVRRGDDGVDHINFHPDTKVIKTERRGHRG